MIVLYWHCLDMTEADEKFVADAAEKLSQFLRTEPTKLSITPKRLKDEHKLAKKVETILAKVCNQSYEFRRCADDILNLLPITVHLLVYSMRCSEIAKAAVSSNDKAKWGLTYPCCLTSNSFAAVYQRDNKFVVWHEALHLLGADDCYEENNPYQKKPDCDFPDGIMQYAPTQENVRDWPFLCNKNVSLIQRKVEHLTRV